MVDEVVCKEWKGKTRIKAFRSEAAMTPKAVPLAGGGAASLRTCVCMVDACLAHAVCWCLCSSGY